MLQLGRCREEVIFPLARTCGALGARLQIRWPLHWIRSLATWRALAANEAAGPAARHPPLLLPLPLLTSPGRETAVGDAVSRADAAFEGDGQPVTLELPPVPLCSSHLLPAPTPAQPHPSVSPDPPSTLSTALAAALAATVPHPDHPMGRMGPIWVRAFFLSLQQAAGPLVAPSAKLALAPPPPPPSGLPALAPSSTAAPLASAAAVGARTLSGMATGRQSEFAEVERQLVASGTSLASLQGTVAQLETRMRREHHVTVVRLVGQLWPSLSDKPTSRPSSAGARWLSRRDQAMELAEQCSSAALSGRVDIGLVVQLLEAWRPMRDRRPRRAFLKQLAAFLVPEADAWVLSLYDTNRNFNSSSLSRQRQCMDLVTNTIGALYQDGSDPLVDQRPKQFSRKKYGLLHAATLAHVAVILEVLDNWDMVLPPFREVLATIAVRRAGYEDLGTLAAVAEAFRSAEITDPRVAAALLEAGTAAAVRRGGGSGRMAADAATAAAARDVATLVRLCWVAGHRDPETYGSAAEALLSYGVGGLDVRELTAVVSAFSEAGVVHPMLLGALASRTKEVLRQLRGKGTAPYGTTAAAAASAKGRNGAVSDSATSVTSPASLHSGLLGCGWLAGGFRALRVEDPELYGDISLAAVRVLEQLDEIASNKATGGLVNPRVIASALPLLLRGFADAGGGGGAGGEGTLPPGLEAQLYHWAPRVVGFMKASDMTSFAACLAQLRLRNTPTLEQLDRHAASLLSEDPSLAPARARRAPWTPRDELLAWPLPSADAMGRHPGEGTREGTREGATSATAWLPAFLESMCHGLAYPCPRTISTLLGSSEDASKLSREDSDTEAWDDVGERDLMGGRGPSDRSAWDLEQALLRPVSRDGDGAADGEVRPGGDGFGRPSGAWATGPPHGPVRRAVTRGVPPGPQPPLLHPLMGLADPDGKQPWAGQRTGPARPEHVCRLLGALACTGALADEGTVRALARALARAFAAAAALPRPPSGSQHAARDPEGKGGRRRIAPAEPDGLSAAAAAAATAALDDAAAVAFFRGFIAASDAGLAAALEDELQPQLAAPLLARGADAWRAAGLGTAAPRPLAAAAAAGAGTGAGQGFLRRLGRGGGDSRGGVVPKVLPWVLRGMGLPVFGACDTPDGWFRLECGVGLGGVMVGVEVLPDSAFVPVVGEPTPATAAATTTETAPTQAEAGSGAGGGVEAAAGGGDEYVLVGDAAFRAQGLRERGWQLVALRASEWAAAEAVGTEACTTLLSRAFSQWQE